MYYVMIMHVISFYFIGISSLVQIWSRRTFHRTSHQLSDSPCRQALYRTICDVALIFTIFKCILLYVSILFQYFLISFQVYCEFIAYLLRFYCDILWLYWYYFDIILWLYFDIFWFYCIFIVLSYYFEKHENILNIFWHDFENILKCSHDVIMILLWCSYVHDMFMIFSGFNLFLLSGCNLGAARLKSLPRDPGQSKQKGGGKFPPGLFKPTWRSVLEDTARALQVLKSMIFQPAGYVTSPGLGLAWDCLVVCMFLHFMIFWFEIHIQIIFKLYSIHIQYISVPPHTTST